MTQSKRIRLVHEIQIGRIKAVIRADLRDPTLVRYNVTVARRIAEGRAWRHTRRFDTDDLPLVWKVLNLAHTWTCQRAAENGADRGGQSLRR